jgi:hypothetical protein
MKYPKGYGIVFKSVLCDPSIRVEVKALYALLASYTGADDFCWPSIPTMAKALDCTQQSIRNWCDELEKAGCLEIQRFNDGVHSNRYWLVLPGRVLNPDIVPSSTPVEEDSSTPVEPTKNTLTSNKDKYAPLQLFGASSKDRQLYPEEFQEFWKIYPRKTEKVKAFKMWKVALRHGADDGELTKAARNYAAECDTKGRAEDYIKHPATFLGPNDHWRDYLKTEIISAEERSEKVQCQACGAKMVPAGSLCSLCRDPFDGGLARERERRRAAGTK